MAIRKRIERLEAKRGKSTRAGPAVVFLVDAVSGEPKTAMLVGGGSITREDGESREAFEARAMTSGPAALSLPGNARDVLASGKAPEWARPKLIIQVLEEKHANTP